MMRNALEDAATLLCIVPYRAVCSPTDTGGVDRLNTSLTCNGRLALTACRFTGAYVWSSLAGLGADTRSTSVFPPAALSSTAAKFAVFTALGRAQVERRRKLHPKDRL